MNILDEEIVELYWRREESAIKETEMKYGGLLHMLAYNILHDNRDCEECQNDTYYAIWNTIPPTRPVVFRAFCVQILRRIAINKYYVKTSKKRIPSELTVSIEECENMIGEEIKLDEKLLAQELGKEISNFVRKLSDKRQYVFMSRFYMVEPVSVIAKELDLTESAIYKEIAGLRKELEKYLKTKGLTV